MPKKKSQQPPFASPFPVRLSKEKVKVNERCACKCLRTEHDAGRAGGFGHGACRRCINCRQFTWMGDVTVQGTTVDDEGAV